MKLTIEKVHEIAKKYYDKGGDVFVECWDNQTLEMYEHLYGEPLTEKALMTMIHVYHDMNEDEKGYGR